MRAYIAEQRKDFHIPFQSPFIYFGKFFTDVTLKMERK